MKAHTVILTEAFYADVIFSKSLKIWLTLDNLKKIRTPARACRMARSCRSNNFNNPSFVKYLNVLCFERTDCFGMLLRQYEYSDVCPQVKNRRWIHDRIEEDFLADHYSRFSIKRFALKWKYKLTSKVKCTLYYMSSVSVFKCAGANTGITHPSSIFLTRTEAGSRRLTTGGHWDKFDLTIYETHKYK